MFDPTSHNRGRRSLLASCSLAALLLGGGMSSVFAACVNVGGGYNNTGAVSGLCVTNTSFTGNIGNSGTISSSGIKFTNGTMSGGINSSGTISGGISIDSASEINSTGTAIAIGGPSFSGGISNSGMISAARTGIYAGASSFSGGISNSGTISAGYTGIDVYGVSSFSGGISNAGTISAASGIDVVSVSSFSGGISNSGTISAGSYGIYVNVSSFSGNISNSGTITAKMGIDIVASTINGAIVDSGTILATSHGILIDSTSKINSTGTAIVIGGPSFSGGISNAGTISASYGGIYVYNVSSFSGGISNSGTLSAGYTGISVDASSFAGGISNAGTISAVIVGISVYRGSFTGGISNAGTISAADYDGIFVSGVTSFSGGISNAGTISAGYYGIYVYGVSSFAGNISNAGTITAKTGIDIVASTINGAIVDSGTILATSHGILIDNTSKINSAGTAIAIVGPSFSGGISNAGMISAARTGIYAGASSFSGGISNAGTVFSAAYGGIYVYRGSFSGGISNSGTISVGDDGIEVYGGTSSFSGGISNSGTISAGIVGIGVDDASNFSGGISNSGTISVAASGVYIRDVSNFTGGISNSGTISAGSDTGVVVSGVSSFSGGISNSGTIFSAGSTGIDVSGVSSFSGGISNAGTISASYRAGIYVNAVSSFSGGISNSGTISASTGIYAYNVSSFSGGISNAGTISAGSGGIVVQSVSSFTGNISNSGTISARTGILIYPVSFAAGGAIVNSGTIIGSAAAIDASAATSAVTIDQNAGLISGAIKLSSNADVLNVNGGTIAGNIVGAGTSDTLNFGLGSGTFTYGASYSFTNINQVNVNSGIIILDGTNSATDVSVNGGTLIVNGTISNSSGVTVNAGGTLTGTGTVDPFAVTFKSGSTFTPGTAGAPGTSITIAGNLELDPGSTTRIYLNPTTSTFATVTGGASLGGTVAASFAPGGGYVSKQYTILTAAGGLGGTTFSGLTNIDLPMAASDSLSYSADDVYLNLTLHYSGLDRNQQSAGNALSNYFNTNGGIPGAFFGLAPGALTQVDGEAATGAEQSAFQMTGSFLSLLLDPYAENRGGGFGPAPAGNASPGPLPVTKGASRSLIFTPSWNVWGAAYGGVGRLSGNATVGSHATTLSGAAFATGADYRIAPDTMLGFALAGGGTGWSLANGLGGGEGAVFQAGLYGVHQFGQAAYLSGAFAFGDYDLKTQRTISLAGGGMLSGNDNAQSYGGRLEGGYHLFTDPVVLTPYGAVQAVNFEAPGYSEYASAGGSTFGLAYNGQSATQTQLEIGSWIDKAMVLPGGMPADLFGRLAYAHDWQTNPSIGASFLALPGSNFTVEGAQLPHNLALVTAGATLQLADNWKLTGKFDGEFAKGAEFYTGAARLQYTW